MAYAKGYGNQRGCGTLAGSSIEAFCKVDGAQLDGCSQVTREVERWTVEPEMDRMVDGFPSWMDEIGALGNAVVPQVAEWIGRQLMEILKNA
jgi:hypothetical protein